MTKKKKDRGLVQMIRETRNILLNPNVHPNYVEDARATGKKAWTSNRWSLILSSIFLVLIVVNAGLADSWWDYLFIGVLSALHIVVVMMSMFSCFWAGMCSGMDEGLSATHDLVDKLNSTIPGLNIELGRTKVVEHDDPEDEPDLD